MRFSRFAIAFLLVSLTSAQTLTTGEMTTCSMTMV
jgi:hypothetical protein